MIDFWLAPMGAGIVRFLLVLGNHGAGGSHFTQVVGVLLGGLLGAHGRLGRLGGLGGLRRLLNCGCWFGELIQKLFLLLQSLLHLLDLLLLKSHLLLEHGDLVVGAGAGFRRTRGWCGVGVPAGRSAIIGERAPCWMPGEASPYPQPWG